MKLLFQTLVLLLYLSSCAVKNQEQSTVSNQENLIDKISTINLHINEWYQNQRIDSLIEMYHPEITFCPEYKPAIFNKTQLKQFYVY